MQPDQDKQTIRDSLSVHESNIYALARLLLAFAATIPIATYMKYQIIGDNSASSTIQMLIAQSFWLVMFTLSGLGLKYLVEFGRYLAIATVGLRTAGFVWYATKQPTITSAILVALHLYIFYLLFKRGNQLLFSDRFIKEIMPYTSWKWKITKGQILVGVWFLAIEEQVIRYLVRSAINLF